MAAALRGGRGPAGAAMALGRRELFRADQSRALTQGLARRSLSTGNGTEVAAGKGTAGSGAGMGPARSWGGCTGESAKEIMDLRADMMDRNQQLWMRVLNVGRDNVDVCADIMKNSETENIRVLKAVSGAVATALAGGLGTLGYLWRKSKESAESDQPQKDLVHKDGRGAVAKPPKEEDGSGAVAKPPNEEDGSGAVAKLPKEEDGGGAVAKLPKEEDGGGAVAKLPKEEDGGGAVAKLPKEEDGGGAVAKLPKEEDGGGAVANPPKQGGGL